ncbi:Conserved hypothetical protein. Putative molybdenum cofactor biosynthesis protein [Geotrichum candidum]|uniref:molybdopterin adenylyltransferase n=1 Tax=Geotrichum candidum TaxID=1173061 RepID=A0A0J9X3X6_GEOCN|nr:Conserved hypothetical protein. Putative molybdenum cofactor biosynthesis protein [Geotrichum candidum]
MSLEKFKVGIVIVSDSCANGTSIDKTGPALRQLLSNHPSYEISHSSIVADNVIQIQRAVLAEKEGTHAQLVLTAGGTGFSPADVTPEAIKPLIEKEAPGIVHKMLTDSLKITPFAALSRPVAGTLVGGGTLVITLPGSPKGASENLESVIDLLPHALKLLLNADSRALHEKEKPPKTVEHKHTHTHGHDHHSHSHSHSHTHSHDHAHKHSHGHGHSHQFPVKHELVSPSSNVTKRSRESPFPMLPVDTALDLIAKHTPAPGEPVTLPLSSPLLAGSVIAEDVYSPDNVPNYRASIVDGYAVADADLQPGVYPVVAVSHASSHGGEKSSSLKSGQIARVTTGAPVPPGTVAVIMVEETELISTTEDGTEEHEVRILAKNIQSGENIREVGSDIKKGSLVISQGTVISGTAGEIGVLASLGMTDSIKVYRKPIVGVLSTGDEVVDTLNGEKHLLEYGEIYDSNRPMLLETIRSWGFEAVDLGIARDVDAELSTTIQKALNQVDLLITTGGVSMGELDLLKPTLVSDAIGGTIHFGRVAMKPGKPTTFVTVPAKDDGRNANNYGDKVVFALPGNPASASVTFHLFVLPALRKMAGQTPQSLPRVRVFLDQVVSLDPRPEYHRVHIAQDPTTGALVATSTGGQRSSRVGSIQGANGLLVLPSSHDAKRNRMEKGDILDAILINRL